MSNTYGICVHASLAQRPARRAHDECCEAVGYGMVWAHVVCVGNSAVVCHGASCEFRGRAMHLRVSRAGVAVSLSLSYHATTSSWSSCTATSRRRSKRMYASGLHKSVTEAVFTRWSLYTVRQLLLWEVLDIISYYIRAGAAASWGAIPSTSSSIASSRYWVSSCCLSSRTFC